MPKKKDSKKEKEEKTEKEELKKDSEKTNSEDIQDNEEDSLEEIIEEESEEINSEQFENFLHKNPDEFFAELPETKVSLERVNPHQPQPIFVGLEEGIGNSNLSNSNSGKENNSFKYIPSNQNKEEPKYIQYEGEVSAKTQKAEEISHSKLDSVKEFQSVKYEPREDNKNSQETYFSVKTFEDKEKNKTHSKSFQERQIDMHYESDH